MLDVQYIKETGKVTSIAPSPIGASPRISEAKARGVTFCIESVPDQSYTHLRDERGIWRADWPGKFVRFSESGRAKYVETVTVASLADLKKLTDRVVLLEKG